MPGHDVVRVAALLSALALAGCSSSNDPAQNAVGSGGTPTFASGGTATGVGGTGTAGSGAPGGGGGGMPGGGASGGGAPNGGASGDTSNGGAASGSGGSSLGGAPVVPPDLSHTFDSISIAPGEEVTGRCQSWTLDNDTSLFVNRVVSMNEGEFHHSNWIWVPDNLYTGADGTWACADRGFDQIAAGAFGGVFFAQSTQALTDTQQFPDGVAFEIPPHARIIGDVHLLNTSEDAAKTSLHFDVYTVPEQSVKVKLQPMAYTNLALDIAPQTKTSARMQCATPQPDFDVYYVLPHFHALGQGMTLDVAGGAMNGNTIFQSTGNIGESLGHMFDPPIHVTGASGLGITCNYQNPRSSTVKYGEGDQEMCVVLIYSSGKKAGGEAISNLTTSDTGGVHSTDGFCVAVGTP